MYCFSYINPPINQEALLARVKRREERLKSRSSQSQFFVPLHLERRPSVGTAAAAHYLDRSEQTLRQWSFRDDGPIRPLRVNGRLAWNVAEIRNLLGVSA